MYAPFSVDEHHVPRRLVYEPCRRTATADGDELVLVVEDAHDRSRTFRLRVVGG